MKTKNLWLILFVVIFNSFIANIIQGSIEYKLEDFEEEKLVGSASALNVNGNSFIKTALSPEFKYGPFAFGLDVNLYYSFGGNTDYPSELNTIVLRHISYQQEDNWGASWGRLVGITYGYGLLIDNYDSGASYTPEFSNSKTGISAFGTFANFRLDTMYTAKNVAAARLSYQIDETFIMGSPFIIGLNYIQDSDGVKEELPGKSIIRPEIKGMGIDLGLPIAGDFLTVYSEYAELYNKDNVKQGRGASAGFKGAFFDFFNYRAEYRLLGGGFAPSYFNNIYESTGFDFSTDVSTSKISGWLVSGGKSLFDDYIQAGFQFEAYEGRDSLLTAGMGWKRFLNTVGVINYMVPFNGTDSAIAEANIRYITGQLLDYIWYYKRIYLQNGLFTETWSFGLRMNLAEAFPGLPF